MHEYGIAETIINAIGESVKRHGADLPIKAWVQFGPLCGMNPEALESVFPIASKGKPTEKMGIDASVKPVSCRCRNCQKEIRLEEYTDMLICEGCGSIDIEFPASAQKIYLTRLELEKDGKKFVVELKDAEMEEGEHHHDHAHGHTH